MQFPRTVDEITAEWLTHALDGHIGMAAVTDVEIEELAGGYTGSVVRATPTYDREGAGPASVVVKLPTSDKGMRQAMATMGMYAGEYHFYRELTDEVGIDTAEVYFVDTDAAGSLGVIVLEDLSAMRTAPTQAGLSSLTSLEDGVAIVQTLARMHAKWWCSPGLLEYDWLVHPGVIIGQQTRADFVANVESTKESYGKWLSSGTNALLELLPANVSKIEQAFGGEPTTLCMGDSRAGNWFFNDSANEIRAYAIDWQSPARYKGAIDVAYGMVFSYGPEVYRKYEPDLMSAYHSELVSGGVADYSFDRFQQDYRWGLFKPLITAVRVLSALKMGEETVRRLDAQLQALEDWDCKELLK